MLKAQLGQPIEGEYPEALVQQYPEIRDILPQSSQKSQVRSQKSQRVLGSDF
jgi:hypothetical protein